MAIRSVLAQTWQDFELIVIDDASPDDTGTRVARYLGDRRVRYLRNPSNLRAEGNWNRCLEEARGEYVKVLPHDDLIEPDCLARQVAALDAHPDVVLSFASRHIIGKGDKPLFVKRAPWKSGRVAADEVLRACVRAGTNLIGEPGAVLFRRSAAERAGVFNASIPYVLDLDYWCRLLAHGDAWCDDAPLASFRVSTGSWSVAIGREQASEFSRFIQAIAHLPQVRAGDMDIAVGRLRARLNNLARRIIYTFVLR
ncbi:MAG: glycosyltransferase family 2 protein [Proteobacteria bacterium]|nr:glycosyltransferase family 2 protein [Pseudomonadota bacterium]